MASGAGLGAWLRAGAAYNLLALGAPLPFPRRGAPLLGASDPLTPREPLPVLRCGARGTGIAEARGERGVGATDGPESARSPQYRLAAPRSSSAQRASGSKRALETSELGAARQSPVLGLAAARAEMGRPSAPLARSPRSPLEVASTEAARATRSLAKSSSASSLHGRATRASAALVVSEPSAW
eukprot:7400407-Alexandrium_andersonii.AAC.1